jgi:ornithine carbamoyltransferase
MQTAVPYRLTMGPAAPPYPPLPPTQVPGGQDLVLLDQARALKRAAAAGRQQPLLRGRNLGLVCRDDGTASAQLFREAATALGAHVAHIECGRIERSAPQELAYAARMLGRLYDAVECQDLQPQLVQDLAAMAGIAVFDGLAAGDVRLTRLALQLDNAAALAENRCFVLQALLLQALT